MFGNLSLFRSRSAPARHDRPATFQPTLEVLEDRSLLASVLGLYNQTALVSDQAGVAQIHDPSLVNAWGVSLSPAGGAFWVSATGTGVTTLYTGDVNGSAFAKSGLTVTIPGGTPTGQVFNSTTGFNVTSGTATARALFLFASTGGHITGWNPAVPLPPPSRQAQIGFSNPGGAAYTGLAIGTSATEGSVLYAADFRNGKIDVFNSTFTPTTLAGQFTDPNLPRTFAPFNIQNINGQLYVTYARQPQFVRGKVVERNGSGFVSVFDAEGNFVRRLASRGVLNSPWGLSLAPADFGKFSGALLVGNHGNGRINAFDPTTGKFLGVLRDESGKPIRIDGLWGLAFGNGISAGDKNALYFAAGPDNGQHGLFGSLRAVDDPTNAAQEQFILSLLANEGDDD